MINYYLLTKPGIILGNLLTVGAGFLLASRDTFNLFLFFETLIGLTLIMASACVFNNYIDRQTDKKMKRTESRPLASGAVSEGGAILFALCLGGAGALILFYYTNLLTVSVAGFGFFVYVVLYSLWKGRTVYGTAIGSLAGATPPVVGYCAASNHLDGGALVLFAMMVLWQMPHFFAIALNHFDDYVAAKIPVLPIQKGIWITKIHMLLYVLAFTLASSLLPLFTYTGSIYLSVALIANLAWLTLSLTGFMTKNDRQWGGRMFRLSLGAITAICVTIPLDQIAKS